MVIVGGIAWEGTWEGEREKTDLLLQPPAFTRSKLHLQKNLGKESSRGDPGWRFCQGWKDPAVSQLAPKRFKSLKILKNQTLIAGSVVCMELRTMVAETKRNGKVFGRQPQHHSMQSNPIQIKTKQDWRWIRKGKSSYSMQRLNICARVWRGCSLGLGGLGEKLKQSWTPLQSRATQGCPSTKLLQ